MKSKSNWKASFHFLCTYLLLLIIHKFKSQFQNIISYNLETGLYSERGIGRMYMRSCNCLRESRSLVLIRDLNSWETSSEASLIASFSDSSISFQVPSTRPLWVVSFLWALCTLYSPDFWTGPEKGPFKMVLGCLLNHSYVIWAFDEKKKSNFNHWIHIMVIWLKQLLKTQFRKFYP